LFQQSAIGGVELASLFGLGPYDAPASALFHSFQLV